MALSRRFKVGVALAIVLPALFTLSAMSDSDSVAPLSPQAATERTEVVDRVSHKEKIAIDGGSYVSTETVHESRSVKEK